MTKSDADEISRRPLKSRSSGWARVVAAWMVASGVRPNFISALSVLFALLASVTMVVASTQADPGLWFVRLLWVIAAIGVQLRLLCNLMDGMVAIEGNRRSPCGELWNEIPDRFADVMILLAAGIASGLPWLGVIAALGAVLTAYVRALGAGLTGKQDFAGPMAKPHRMAMVTVAALGSAVFPAHASPIFGVFLGVMVLGLVLTLWFRVRTLARSLQSP